MQFIMEPTRLWTELAKFYDINGGIGVETGDDYVSGVGFARVK